MNRSQQTPPVAIIILNYNGMDHLRYCLPSILDTDYPALEVIVVDNASTDDSVRYIKQNFPHVTLLESATNRGWAGGNNLGIVYALQRGATYVILANNDIRVDRRWVRVATNIAEEDPRMGIVGFRIFSAHGSEEDRGFRQAVKKWASPEVVNSRSVDGMAMLVRASLFDQIGYIDEGFFAYAEDNDFELRARKAGYRVVATNVPVWHYGQGTFGRMPLRAAWLQIRNNIRLSIKHDSPAGIAWQVARHVAKGCLPFVKVDRSNLVARRLRPSNPLFNFLLIVGALAWNVWHLPETLRRRRQDRRRIQTALEQQSQT